MSHYHPINLGWSVQGLRWLGLLTQLVGLLALTSGCVLVVPVPTAYHPPGSRRNLTADTAGRFARGGATVYDVVLALGEPDEAVADASQLTYRWERVNLHLLWGWAIPLGETAVGQTWEKTYSRRYAVSFEFDPAGLLQGVKATNERNEVTREQ